MQEVHEMRASGKFDNKARAFGTSHLSPAVPGGAPLHAAHATLMDPRSLQVSMLHVAIVTKLAPRRVFASVHAGERLCQATELVQAVCAMHDADIVHGDLKPGNVRVDDGGHVCILDVESALVDWQHMPATTRARVTHTEGYAAPEVEDGVDCTPASDVYSLGVMLRDHVSVACSQGMGDVVPQRVAVLTLVAGAHRLAAAHG